MSDELDLEECLFASAPEGAEVGELYRRMSPPSRRSGRGYGAGRARVPRRAPAFPPRVRARAAPAVRPWPRYRAPPLVVPLPPEGPAGSERVRWIQDCLNQALGLGLPITGFMGPETRDSVQRFQRQQGLRASGIVGPDTEERLRAACRDARTVPGDLDELGWDLGRSLDRGWPARMGGGDLEEEILVRASCAIDLRGHQDLELHRPTQWVKMSREPGIYRIYTEDKTLYVGRSGNVRARFDGRRKALSDFGLSLGVLAGRKVGIYALTTDKTCSLSFRRSGGRSTEPRTLQDKLLALAETALVNHFKPAHTDPGKLQNVRVLGGTLTIRLDGRVIHSLGRGGVLTTKG